MIDTAASEAARVLAAMRRREIKNCGRCGKEFAGISKARYCSHECAVASYWDQHREELNRQRRERYQRQKGVQGGGEVRHAQVVHSVEDSGVPPLVAYYGSKYAMRKVILSLFPPHRVFVDLFGGSGIVLLSKPSETSEVEVYNDLDQGMTTLFRVVRDKPKELVDALNWSLYSRDDYKQAVSALGDPGKDMEIARRAYLLANATLCGGGKRMYASNFRVNKNGNSSAEAFRRKIPRIDKINERMHGVIVENMDWRKVINRYDTPKTLFYIDPPYANVDNTYEYTMTQQDHIDLCERLATIKGMFVLSGYDGIYTKYLEAPLADGRPWCFRHEHKQRNISKSNVPGGRVPAKYETAKEVLWYNYEIEKGANR